MLTEPSRCPRCGNTLPPEPTLGRFLQKVRAWSWRAAHWLNCPVIR